MHGGAEIGGEEEKEDDGGSGTGDNLHVSLEKKDGENLCFNFSVFQKQNQWPKV